MKRIVLAIAVSLFPVATYAGTTGVLSGIVTDDQFAGAPSANASVTATSPSQTATTKTDSRGRYVFPSLIPGTYTIAFDVTAYGRLPDRETLQAIVIADGRTIASVRFPYRIIVENRGNLVERLVRPGIVADLYRLGSLWPASQPNANASLLRFTPGINFGTGAPTTP